MDPWHASLALDFRRAEQRTTMAARHRGPLRVQKALYPEGEAVCHGIVLHPPGGIAGGDALAIEVDVKSAAHALLTTPGAAKWYKANGRPATQSATLRVAGTLDWLPQEAIVFAEADVRSEIRIDVAPDAAMIGWDIVALGRAESGETFDRGRFAQSIRLHDDGELQWVERTRLDGNDELLASPTGLDGNAVFGCLWAVGPRWTDQHIDALRAEVSPDTPLTRLGPRLVVARALGATTAAVRGALEPVWAALRPRVLARRAVPPRIWST
jgi:urease accessory protein